MKEALEANEWDQPADTVDEDEDKDTESKPADDDAENMDFGLGQADIESLKKAIWAGSQGASGKPDEDQDDIDDQDVAKVEAMMRKLQAAREAGESMSETQRRKMAAKAVEEVMREL